MTNHRGHSYVPPSGPKDAKIAIVGEQPGRQEVIRRKPFIGPAGRELDDCLATAGINRFECYITNVIKDLDKPLASYIQLLSRGKNQILPFGQSYIDELKEELESISSNVIVAIGNVALYALCDRTGITKWRGSILESTLLPGRKVIPTIHSATILPPKFVFTNKYLIAHDLTLVNEQSEFSEISLTPRKYLINGDYHEIIGFLDEMYKYGLQGCIVYFDIELYNEEVSCISFSIGPNIAMSIPFINSQGDYLTIDQEINVWKFIAKILEDIRIRKGGQNLIFDTHLLMRMYGIKTHNIVDTMVAQQILFPDYPKGLDFITSIYTDLPYYKAEGKKWFKTGGAWETLWTYNAMDSIACADAYPKQLSDIERQGNTKTLNRQTKLVEPLSYMMERGIRVDMEGMEKERVSMLKQADELQEELNTLAGRPLNPNSPKQLINYFYVEKGLPPYLKKGKMTTDVTAMKRLAKPTSKRKGLKEASIISKMRSLIKISSTYLTSDKIDSDSRIRCSYNPVGTRYSRISSSENIFGTGMNMQNWPHSTLKYLLADKGYMYYSLDESQFENRIVAYVGRITQMIDAFESGIDVHKLTASSIFNKHIDDVTTTDNTCPIGDGTHSERYWGKKTNHELNYDMSYKTFALEQEISEHQAKIIVEGYHQMYPGVRQQYHSMIRLQLRENRTLTNLMGRKTKFMGRWDDKLFREAYSCIPQGTCGDVINERGVNYIYYNQDLFAPVELLTQVHDSIGFQIPLSLPWIEHSQILALVKNSLETPLVADGLEFTVPVDIFMGLNFGEGTELKHQDFPETIGDLSIKLKEAYNDLSKT